MYRPDGDAMAPLGGNRFPEGSHPAPPGVQAPPDGGGTDGGGTGAGGAGGGGGTGAGGIGGEGGTGTGGAGSGGGAGAGTVTVTEPVAVLFAGSGSTRSTGAAIEVV